MNKHAINAKNRLRHLATTKASVRNIVKDSSVAIANKSVSARKDLTNSWAKRFGSKDSFLYANTREIASILNKQNPAEVITFLLDNNVVTRNNPNLRSYKERAFVLKQKLSDSAKINDTILELTQKATPPLSGNQVVLDWLIENGFECPVVDGNLVMESNQKRKLNTFIVNISRDFSARAPNAPYTTYYPATHKDYTDALQIIGFNPKALDIRSIRIGQALEKLSTGATALFSKDDIDEVGLTLMFQKMRVPVNIEKVDEGLEVSATGLFPQSKDLQKFLADELEPIKSIKLLFPSNPIVSSKEFNTLIQEMGAENIQKMDIPRTVWTKLYPQFIAAYNEVFDSEVESDQVLFNDVMHALHMDTKIEGLDQTYMFQLMNDGAILLLDKPSLADSIADILNGLGFKAKVDSSKFGTLVKFDSKKAYSYFYE